MKREVKKRRINPASTYLTVRQVADLTGFSMSTVYSWIAEGLIKAGIGSRQERLIRDIDLEKFLLRFYDMTLDDINEEY